MGFVTNRWQPTSSGPGPIPIPTWERVKNGVKATTAFNYSSLNYTEYLILVYKTSNNVNYCYEFFYIPEFGNQTQRAGYTNTPVYIEPTTSSTIAFRVSETGSNKTSSYKYTIYGRNKAAWSLVSDNSSLPNYTEFVSANGYYTPFNFQDNYARTSGGNTYSKDSYGSRITVSYGDYKERIYNNAYTYGNGSGLTYTRLSASESNWTHINSTNSSVSIENISYSEMFIVGRYMQLTGTTNEFQTLYLIPAMIKGHYNAGGYTTCDSSNRYSGSYGALTVSDTSISAAYTKIRSGTTSSTFQSIDIYYR